MPARPLVLAVAALLLATSGSAGQVSAAAGAVPSGSATAPAGVVRYAAPVPGAFVVVRPFVPPPTPYSAGHRGVDLRSPAGGAVLAAGDGTVRFAGPVAGRGVVVLAHPDGITTEYEPVQVRVRAGQAVRRGDLIGVLAGRHPGCAADCLHWGAKRAGAYFDPLSLLRPLGPVVLLPWTR